MVGFLLVLGLSPGEKKFWILLAAIEGPFVLWELIMYVTYARRGKSYFEFKRGLGEMTLAELQRRKEARRP